MTAATLTLTDFLLARIAEDEAAARAATPAPWFATREAVSTVPDEVDDELGATWNDGPGVMHASFEGNGAANAVHIARHDPARVLAEGAAKRAIVELHSGENDARCQSYNGNWVEAPCETLRAVAAVYADHPDYRDEWRP